MNNKQRILDGITYFNNVKPSEWNEAHKAHLTFFLNKLLKPYMLSQKTVENMTESEINAMLASK